MKGLLVENNPDGENYAVFVRMDDSSPPTSDAIGICHRHLRRISSRACGIAWLYLPSIFLGQGLRYGVRSCICGTPLGISSGNPYNYSEDGHREL